MEPRYGIKTTALLLSVAMLAGMCTNSTMPVRAAPVVGVSSVETHEDVSEKKSDALTGAVVWDDDNDKDSLRPERVTVYLNSEDGKLLALQSASVFNGWQYSFDTTSQSDVQVSAESVVGYTTAIQEDHSITYRHEIGKTSFPVSIVWNDSNDIDGKRPKKLVVQLIGVEKKNGDGKGKKELVDHKKVNAENEWSCFFEDVPMAGHEYKLKVKGLPDGYESKVTGSVQEGYTVLLKRDEPVSAASDASAMRNAEVMCIWDDGGDIDGLRPKELNVTLFANNSAIASKTISESDGWGCVFENLPIFDGGDEIQYEVTAVGRDGIPVDGYTLKNDGLVLTLHHQVKAVDMTANGDSSVLVEGNLPKASSKTESSESLAKVKEAEAPALSEAVERTSAFSASGSDLHPSVDGSETSNSVIAESESEAEEKGDMFTNVIAFAVMLLVACIIYCFVAGSNGDDDVGEGQP